MSGELRTGSITFDDLSEQRTAADRSFRNKVINGDMAINQQYGSTEVTPIAGTTYIADQFKLVNGMASKLKFQQVADAPDGFKFSTKITVASQYSPAAADYFVLEQSIEGQNIVDMNFGKASAKTISLSLWVKGSVSGKYSIAIRNSALNTAYVGNINVTPAWVKQSITLRAATEGVWATDNTAGVLLDFDLGSGSDWNTTANNWVASNKFRTSDSVTFVNQPVGSTLNITGVQFEIGAPSEFEMVPYDEQLRRCQRYFNYLVSVVNVRYNTTGSAQASYRASAVTFPTMRVIPSPSTANLTMSVASGFTFNNTTTKSVTPGWTETTANSTTTVTSDIILDARL